MNYSDFFFSKLSRIELYPLTRAAMGGTLRYFLGSSKTKADMNAKLLVPYSAPIWHLLAKFQKIRREILRKLRFSDVMFYYFGSKSGKYLKASKMYSFEVKRNPKTLIGVKLCALQNGYLRILIFFVFDPKTQNFALKKAFKIQHFGVT